MSFHPAGAEDSESDEDGFYMGSSYSANTGRDKHPMNDNVNLKYNVNSQRNFTAMPAGAESDDEGIEGLEFRKAPAQSTGSSAQTDGKRRQHGYKNTSDGLMTGASGVGRGRGQLQQRGRGRGGFPRPPSSYSNRGKSTKRFVCNKHMTIIFLYYHQNIPSKHSRQCGNLHVAPGAFFVNPTLEKCQGLV